MIEIRHLWYAYPDAAAPVLRDVSLTVDKGELALVTGVSGAGKSTLLRTLNGLVPHFAGGTCSGEVLVAGRNAVAEGPYVLSRDVGFVFQDPEAQFVVDRVEDEVAFALEQRAVPPPEMHRRVEQALAQLNLLSLRDRPLETLSGGERQRVAIAAALALHPEVLVLDEPTSQLDPDAAQGLLEAIVRLNRDLGLTVVLAEHRLERVLEYADRLIHLQGAGEPVLSGLPQEVLAAGGIGPPVVALGRALGWRPLPLSVAEARRLAAREVLEEPESTAENRPDPGGSVAVAGSAEPAPADPLLEVRGLSFAYGQEPLLDGVDMRVTPGELVALMGCNGAGKTTLLRSLVGLLQPLAGEVLVEGRSVRGRSTAEICARVGYLPQQPDDLLFADTVRQELEATLRNHRMLAQPPIAPETLLGRLGLGGLAEDYPRDLSVGQRQRVALAAVTVTRPPLLLLDEPTRGMDYAAKEELVDLLRAWQAEGTGILLVTHDVELVAQAADRVLILSAGRISADGSPSRVLTSEDTFSPQVARVFPGQGWLTVDDALNGLRAQQGQRCKYPAAVS